MKLLHTPYIDMLIWRYDNESEEILLFRNVIVSYILKYFFIMRRNALEEISIRNLF